MVLPDGPQVTQRGGDEDGSGCSVVTDLWILGWAYGTGVDGDDRMDLDDYGHRRM